MATLFIVVVKATALHGQPSSFMEVWPAEFRAVSVGADGLVGLTGLAIGTDTVHAGSLAVGSVDSTGAFAVQFGLDLEPNWIGTGPAFPSYPAAGLDIEKGGTETYVLYGYLAFPENYNEGGIRVTSYDIDGNVMWYRDVTDPLLPDVDQTTLMYDMAVDMNGTVYIIGAVGESNDVFGAAVSGNNPGAFMASLDSNGALKWIKGLPQVGTSAFGSGIESGRNCLSLIATFQSGAVLEPGTADEVVLSEGGSYVVQYGWDGSYLKHWPVVSWQHFDVSLTGRVAVTGYFRNSLSVGDSLFVDEDDFGDAFIAVYDEDGSLIWARQLKTDGAGVTAVKFDSLGDLYVGGQIDGSGTFVDLGGRTLVKSPEALHNDEFLARYNAKGELIWSEQISGSGSMHVSDIDIDEWGNLYVAGTLHGSVAIAGSEYRSHGDGDGIVARFDARTITLAEPDVPRPTHESQSPFPNPTSGYATLGVTLARDEPVSVRLYDLSGRLVRAYATGILPPGRRYVTINGAGLPGGRYLYRISTSSTEKTGVMVLSH